VAVNALTTSGGTVLFELLVRLQSKALDTYDEKKAAALFARFVKNRTWQVPTQTVRRALAFVDDEKFTNDSRVKYIPASLTDGWKRVLRSEYRGELSAERKRIFQKTLELVKAMHAAAVPCLAGTDTPNPYCFPGFSLHDELELLVTKCGFTPMEALQTATRNPAEYLARLKDLGTVEKGKLADLVLLDADPLDDIHNTTKINAVVVNGKLLPQATLQAMLEKVEAECKEKETPAKPAESSPSKRIKPAAEHLFFRCKLVINPATKETVANAIA
jgi:hypothetical protein